MHNIYLLLHKFIQSSKIRFFACLAAKLINESFWDAMNL